MKNITAHIQKIIAEVEKLVPVYMQIEEDRVKNDGNVSVCIIDGEGAVHGRMFGNDKIKVRETFRLAWIKASQVHITGIKTGEFEKLAFANEIDGKKFGIAPPDYVGYRGGVPVTLEDGTVLSIGFSGFRGITDLEIIDKAVAAAGGRGDKN